MRVTFWPLVRSRIWPTRERAESTCSPLTAVITSPTFRPAFDAGVLSPTEVSLAPAREADPSVADPSSGVTPR